MWASIDKSGRLTTRKIKLIVMRQLSTNSRLILFIIIICVLWYLKSRLFYSQPNNMEGVPYSLGLQLKNREFILNGKPLWIISGAMHYFRVVPEYWKDRMLKMKAGGLNTLETYVSWNLHEPLPGHFNFEGILNLRKYIELAQEIGLYVILRPGPFICSEWDFGGMPSWLLKDPNMKVRSNYKPYQEAVTRFFDKLIIQVEDLQASRGGPIIMVQVENEFGSYSAEIPHLQFIADLLRRNGIQELLMTSDNDKGMTRAPFYNVAFPAANFKKLDEKVIKHIYDLNPDFPFMVMEYWSGWFDHWGMHHHIETTEFHGEVVSSIFKRKGSINFYMYHGGTNFGFMAGANFFDAYKADVTSYDYDAPISEAGDITPKYLKTRELILEYVLKPQGITTLPDPPKSTEKANYGQISVESYLPWEEVLLLVKNPVKSRDVVTMEMLELDSGYGQSYGYIVYQKYIDKGDNLHLGTVNDRAQVLINSREVGKIEPNSDVRNINLNSKQGDNVLDIIVENLGRVNFILIGSNLLNEQRKGLSSEVTLDGTSLKDWKIYPLDFNRDFVFKVSSSSKWRPYKQSNIGIFKASLLVQGEPLDTFLNMEGWKKGIVILNGFNLGRYWDIGPQKTLYVPAPILKMGVNEILIFEQHGSHNKFSFQSTPDLGPIKPTV